MQNPRLASRYAKSLLDIAKEQNMTDAVLADMQYIETLCQQSKDFSLMLQSPIVKGDKKLAIINAVVGNNITPLTQAFFGLLIKKGREQNIKEIATAFIHQYKAINNINTVSLTTAQPISDTTKTYIEAKINDSFKNGTVELNTVLDESIIGGFVLEVGDRQFDASIRRDLNDIKSQFTKNLYVADI